MLVKEFKDGQWQVIDNGFGTYYADNQTRGMLKADGDTITTNNGVITCQKQKYAFNTELQYIYPGTYQWQVPDGVEFIKVLVIGGGSNGYIATLRGGTKGYTGGSGAISALLKVTPKETIELTVGKNADGVYLWDGRITTTKTFRTKTSNQRGGTASFGDWITAPSGSVVSDWRTRPNCTFKQRDTKYDRIITGFTWEKDLAGNRTGRQIATSINTTDITGTNFDSFKYWRTLKAVCDNYQGDQLQDGYTDTDPVHGLTWRVSGTSTNGKDGLMQGQQASPDSVNYQGGNAYGLFGLGGAGSRGTTNGRQSSSGGDAVNFGGVGGYGYESFTKSTNYSCYSGSCGAAGPGGIFIWY